MINSVLRAIHQGGGSGADIRFRAEAYVSTQNICAKAAPWLNKSRGPELVAAFTIMIILATIAFVLRVIARKMAKLKFGIDDWLITLALVRGSAGTDQDPSTNGDRRSSPMVSLSLNILVCDQAVISVCRLSPTNCPSGALWVGQARASSQSE